MFNNSILSKFLKNQQNFTRKNEIQVNFNNSKIPWADSHKTLKNYANNQKNQILNKTYVKTQKISLNKKENQMNRIKYLRMLKNSTKRNLQFNKFHKMLNNIKNNLKNHHNHNQLHNYPKTQMINQRNLKNQINLIFSLKIQMNFLKRNHPKEKKIKRSHNL